MGFFLDLLRIIIVKYIREKSTNTGGKSAFHDIIKDRIIINRRGNTLRQTIDGIVHNEKLGQVFTKASVAESMVNLLDLPKDASILDPCFGDGIFIKSLLHKGFTNIEGYEIDSRFVNRLKNKKQELKITCKDFLTTQKKFDGIIMNPPYIRQENIDNLSEYGVSKDILRRQSIFKWLPRTSNLYMYFVVKAVELLNDGGQLVVIFPDSWNKAKTGTLFRQFLVNNCTIAEKISMENISPFDDEVLTNVVILKIIKGTTKQKQTLTQKQDSLTNYLTVGLPSIAKIRRGITTGANSLFINPPINSEDGSLTPVLSSPKDYNGYSTKDAILDKLLLVNGESVSQEVKDYLNICSDKIEKSQKPKSLYAKKQRGEKWYPFRAFDCSGLIFSYFVRSEMKFAINPSGVLVRDNFYIINSDLDIYLLFALMNNYFTYYQLEESGKKYGAGLLKIQCYDLQNIMLPNIKTFSEQSITAITNEAKEILKTNNNNGISKITEVIANEIGFNFEDIKEMYDTKKRRRLNAVA